MEWKTRNIFVVWAKRAIVSETGKSEDTKVELVPLESFDLEITANRYAEGRGHAGTKAIVLPGIAYQDPESGNWYAPCKVVEPSTQDLNEMAYALKKADIYAKLEASDISIEDVKEFVQREKL